VFVKNERGNYVNVSAVDVIGVAPAVDSNNIHREGLWSVYLTAGVNVHHLPPYRSEDEAREAAEKIAGEAGVIEVPEPSKDGGEG
jgi:hypothetical protein